MIIVKNCRHRKCGVRFEQETRQTRPSEYCSIRCNYAERRLRKSAQARAKYAREKGKGHVPEERVESLDFGA